MSQREQLPTAEQPAATGIDRRSLLATVDVGGAGVVGAVALAACGGGTGRANQSGGAGSTAARSPGSVTDVVKAADIPVGGGTVFEAAKVVVTQPKPGEFKAFSAICTHMGCTVSGIANGMIACRCHGSTYDIATAQVTGGPAPASLPSRTVTVLRRLDHGILTGWPRSLLE